MKMRHLQLPSGRTHGIPFLIDANWSPEQAMAVVELLDDLREQIWRHYALQFYPLFREDRIQENIGSPGNHKPESSDEPF
jgi:hypothetical protein